MVEEKVSPNVHSNFFLCFSKLNLVTKTHGHLARDCISYSFLHSMTTFGPVGACKNMCNFYIIFLKIKLLSQYIPVSLTLGQEQQLQQVFIKERKVIPKNYFALREIIRKSLNVYLCQQQFQPNTREESLCKDASVRDKKEQTFLRESVPDRNLNINLRCLTSTSYKRKIP